MAALGLAHAGDWLTCIPSPILGLHLRDREFKVMVLYRLGAPVFESDGKCPACPNHSDKRGDHAISCGYEGERIARHNHLRDAIFGAASSAALAPLREERALLPGLNNKPADVLIPHWTGGQDTAFDVTVINPLKKDLLSKEAEAPGNALGHAYDRKWGQVGELCEREGIKFIPLPVETLGGWGEGSVVHLKRIGAALAARSGREEAEVCRHLMQKLSILLMGGNAQLLLNRVPAFPSADIDGVV